MRMQLTKEFRLKKILIRNEECNLEDKSLVNITGTNLIIKLTEKLGPKSKLNLSFDWEIKIPTVQAIQVW